MSSAELSLVPYKPPVQIPEPEEVILVQEEQPVNKSAGYWLTRPIALLSLYTPAFKSLYKIAQVNRALEYAREFMSDIGGVHTFIRTKDGTRISAMYFDPAIFKQCHNGAFLKWRRIFEESSDSQMSKVTGWYEIDRDGADLRQLMRLPLEAAQEDDGQKIGVIQCLGRGCLYEGNPQAAMTYLYRGKHVILFNYRGMGLSEGSPGYLETCHDALAVTDWMHEKLNCKSNQLVIQGFSMGSGPAVYAASRTPNLDLIIDRGFSRLSAVKVSWCLERAFKYMAENFYPYPNDELLPQVRGRVLIIQAENDLLIDGSHAARLFEILAVAKLGPDASEDAVESFRAKTWIVVNGGHNSKCCGDEDYAWYAHGPSQKKVSGFFID